MKSDLLQKILDRADIPAHVQHELFNAITNPKRHGPDAVAEDWRALLDRARHARRMVMTNKPRWAPDVAQFYQRYIDILSLVAERIVQASKTLDAEGQPMSLEAFTARRAAVNRRRIAEGKPPLGTCGTRWQNWVPAHIRTQLMHDVEAHYGFSENGGARFTPFITRELKRESETRIGRVKAALKNITRTCANMGTAPPMADNLYGALHLAAARQAERALHKYTKTANMLDTQCPVNWLHLLEPKMRARLNLVRKALREGEVYDIPIEWCRGFYMEPQAQYKEDVVAPMLDAELFDGLEESVEADGDVSDVEGEDE